MCTYILNVLTGLLSNVDNFFIVTDKYFKNLYQVDGSTGSTGQLLPFGTATEPHALAYDSTNNVLYWTDNGVHTINMYSRSTNSTTVIYEDSLGRRVCFTRICRILRILMYKTEFIYKCYRRTHRKQQKLEL